MSCSLQETPTSISAACQSSPAGAALTSPESIWRHIVLQAGALSTLPKPAPVLILESLAHLGQLTFK